MNGVRRLVSSGELDERLDHWSVSIKFGKMGQRLYFFSDFFNFTFKLDPTATHLKIVNNSEGFTKGIDSLLVFSLADSVVSSLLSSEGGTVFDSLGKESNVFDSSSKLVLGISKETLGVGNGLFTLNLGSGVSVSLSSRAGDFSLADNQILVVLSISGFLLTLFLGNELVDKSNNIIDNTFGSEVNL